jgi:hypothetical protein
MLAWRQMMWPRSATAEPDRDMVAATLPYQILGAGSYGSLKQGADANPSAVGTSLQAIGQEAGQKAKVMQKTIKSQQHLGETMLHEVKQKEVEETKAVASSAHYMSSRADAQLAYSFEVTGSGNDYAGCSGQYVMAEGLDNELNGRPYYVNKEKDRFLAWTGFCWEITAMGYLPSVRQHHAVHGFWPGSFGGFHAGAFGAALPSEGKWEDYVVRPWRPERHDRYVTSRATAAVQKASAEALEDSDWEFRFVLRPGASDFGDCAGVYTLAEGSNVEINKKPHYVKEDKTRILVWTGQGWKLMSPDMRTYFHSGSGVRPDLASWLSYDVRREKSRSALDEATGYRFTAKPAAMNIVTCAGDYSPVEYRDNELNGKLYYVNAARQCFLAWNSASAAWVVSAMSNLPAIQRQHRQHGYWPGAFGGFHSAEGERPDDAVWSEFLVTPLNLRHLGAAEEYVFTNKPSARNYAMCDGVYKIAEGKDFELNGRPYFVCSERQRFLAWSGSIWEITATCYLEGIKKHHKKHGFWPGTFGGFHAGGGEWPSDGKWAEYDVIAQGKVIALPSDDMSDAT